MICTVPGLPRDSSVRPNGSFSTSLKVLASTASTPAVNFASIWPLLIFVIQRFIDAITSAVVTGWPSWNVRFGRSVKV